MQTPSFKVGDFCLAPYVEYNTREYFRARIEQLQGNVARVFFVDYGNTSDVNVQELYQLHRAFCNLPFQAFECELWKLKPSPIKCPTGQWTSEAQQRFEYYTSSAKTLCAKIYSVVHDVLRIELFANINEIETNINLELMRLNYADEAEESFLSYQNNQLREQAILQRSRSSAPSVQQPARNLPSIHEAVKHSSGMATGARKRFGSRVTLKGPWNSYEIGFGGCTFSGKIRPVRVERDSINAVALNDELRGGKEEVKVASRMLVAAEVILNSYGDVLTARDTTLMPSIPGLLAIVSLLFSPSAELRADKDKTRYTGALCGLGWDMESSEGDSAFPDHDMEIVFDFHFDVTDLSLINKLRIAINLSLSGDFGPEIVESHQRRTREQLLKLIETKRAPAQPMPFHSQYRWRQVDPEDVIQPAVDEMRQGTVLYNLHSGIVLNDPLQVEDESSLAYVYATATDASGMTLQQKQAHNNWLQSKASRSKERENIHCRLCNRVMWSPYELVVHLTSIIHRQNSSF